MARQNQGFRQELNLQENINDNLTLDNLGGVGISNDLAIIQNNLRNISTVSFQFISDGYFFTESENPFVFTNNDIVTIDRNISVGTTTLTAGTEYYVCESRGEGRFKLSITPSTIGLSTINVTAVEPDEFTFIRKDAVSKENLINFIRPDIFSSRQFGFDFFEGRTINETINEILSLQETGFSLLDLKYKTNRNTTTTKDINTEGTISLADPDQYNLTGIGSTGSPGVFIGGIRAFSDTNNPWTEVVGAGLSTLSSEVSIEELYLQNNISITGIGTTTFSSANNLISGGSNALDPYKIINVSGPIRITLSGPTILSDRTSTEWSIVNAVNNVTNYLLLIQGQTTRLGQWQLWATDLTGRVNFQSPWRNDAALFGYEKIFGVDLNGDGNIDTDHTNILINENLMYRKNSQLATTILNDGNGVTQVTDTSIANPFGVNDGVFRCTHTTNTTGYFRRGELVNLTAGVTYTFSVYFRNGTVSNPYGRGGTFPGPGLTITSGVGGGTGPIFETFEYSLNTNIFAGNGWYRQVFIFIPSHTQVYQVTFNQALNQTPIGTYYLYGFQLETGTTVTDYIKPYRVTTPSGPITITSNGQPLSNASSTLYDATRAVKTGSGYNVLTEWTNGNYTVWTANSSGSIVNTTEQINATNMSAQGYDYIFNVDFNGNGFIGPSQNTSSSISVSSFTHKLPMNINGEIYYLLLV